MFCAILSNADKHRELAQFGSALRSGRRGHGFESRIPDFFYAFSEMSLTIRELPYIPHGSFLSQDCVLRPVSSSVICHWYGYADTS